MNSLKNLKDLMPKINSRTTRTRNLVIQQQPLKTSKDLKKWPLRSLSKISTLHPPRKELQIRRVQALITQDVKGRTNSSEEVMEERGLTVLALWMSSKNCKTNYLRRKRFKTSSFKRRSGKNSLSWRLYLKLKNEKQSSKSKKLRGTKGKPAPNILGQ